MNAKLAFLGVGASMGVPVIGCTCQVCLSTDPKNKRLRPSALLHIDKKTILIDCGPDFRTQAIRAGVSTLDGVIFTHAHQDHTGGIDDLRVFHMRSKQPLPCLISQECLGDIQRRFSYIFSEHDSGYDKLLPKFQFSILSNLRGEAEIAEIPLRYFTYEQAGMRINGFRFGNLAYVTDIKHYPDSIYEDLEGVEILIISALRSTPSPIHFHIDEAVDFIQKVGARKSWLVHLAHEVEYSNTNEYLPENIRVAYDGLEIDFFIPDKK